ncbi:hypothetical protein M3Y95_01036700 [Aphelenchoides besseyi]|nr:hypothetical protein M3Y95_01036700 [Aphelenchoides besseyi]
MKTRILLLALIHLAIQKPIDDPCASNTFTVDEFTFGSYTNARFDSGVFYDTDDNFIFLPTTVYETVLDKLNAQGYTYVDFVACDSKSLATYPDLVFTSNGTKVVLHPTDYIVTDDTINNMCMLLIEDVSIAQSSYDYALPIGFKSQLCSKQK